MNPPEKRLPTYALVPWVCALVAILGCNVPGAHSLSLRKMKFLDGSSLTQVAPETPATGNAPNPPALPALDPLDGIQLIDPSSSLTAHANRTDLPTVSARGGERQGRAPPEEDC